MVNYFILSSSSLVCVVKKEREERGEAEFATTKCELSLGAGWRKGCAKWVLVIEAVLVKLQIM